MMFLFCLVWCVVRGTYVIIYSVFSREIEGQLDRGLRRLLSPPLPISLLIPETDVFEFEPPTSI